MQSEGLNPEVPILPVISPHRAPLSRLEDEIGAVTCSAIAIVLEVPSIRSEKLRQRICVTELAKLLPSHTAKKPRLFSREEKPAEPKAQPE